jgi:uncharacterized membrane protein (UPF0127 family)
LSGGVVSELPHARMVAMRAAVAFTLALGGLTVGVEMPGLGGPAAATVVLAPQAPARAIPVQAAAADEFVAVLETATGPHRFAIEIADTPDERAQGLMFRETMAADAGMLFDYGFDQQGVAFWMKNTPLPLDMIFIRSDGTITQIAADTTPFSLEPVPSVLPVRFVLEVNAGTAKRLGLKPGDRLRHPRTTPR